MTIRDRIYALIHEIVPDVRGYTVEFLDDEKKGHYATNCAFLIAKKEGKSPMEVAEEVARKLTDSGRDVFHSVKAAHPGFVNMRISSDELAEKAKEAILGGPEFGKNDSGKGKRVRIEYVSANPTGPVHIGNARGGPYGEALARAFEMNGYDVLREYLHNDIGGQVEKLGLTVWYWYEKLRGKETDFPEGGYQGTYIEEVAKAATERFGSGLASDDISKLTDFALNFILNENKEVLERLGIQFDSFVSEGSFIASGKTKESIDTLKEKNLLKEADGALWFAPNDEFLEDRESVVVRSNGKPTYFASDIAYHREKFESGYDLVFDIFGSNHHGHVPKLKALTKIFNFDPEKFIVLLYQFVRVKRGSEIVKMSKRAGTYVTAREVLDEVGPDNMIFSLLSSAPSTHIDFDLDLAKEQSMKNPVYYVQYAHVRAENIIEKSGVGEIKNLDEVFDGYDFSVHETELLRRIAVFPEIVSGIAKDYEVHQITRYAFELARAFHNFYEHERVVGEEDAVFKARLAIVFAARNVFRNLFRLIGISAPKKM